MPCGAAMTRPPETRGGRIDNCSADAEGVAAIGVRAEVAAAAGLAFKLRAGILCDRFIANPFVAPLGVALYSWNVE